MCMFHPYTLPEKIKSLPRHKKAGNSTEKLVGGGFRLNTVKLPYTLHFFLYIFCFYFFHLSSSGIVS